MPDKSDKTDQNVHSVNKQRPAAPKLQKKPSLAEGADLVPRCADCGRSLLVCACSHNDLSKGRLDPNPQKWGLFLDLHSLTPSLASSFGEGARLDLIKTPALAASLLSLEGERAPFCTQQAIAIRKGRQWSDFFAMLEGFGYLVVESMHGLRDASLTGAVQKSVYEMDLGGIVLLSGNRDLGAVLYGLLGGSVRVVLVTAPQARVVSDDAGVETFYLTPNWLWQP